MFKNTKKRGKNKKRKERLLHLWVFNHGRGPRIHVMQTPSADMICCHPSCRESEVMTVNYASVRQAIVRLRLQSVPESPGSWSATVDVQRPWLDFWPCERNVGTLVAPVLGKILTNFGSFIRFSIYFRVKRQPDDASRSIW